MPRCLRDVPEIKEMFKSKLFRCNLKEAISIGKPDRRIRGIKKYAMRIQET